MHNSEINTNFPCNRLQSVLRVRKGRPHDINPVLRRSRLPSPNTGTRFHGLFFSLASSNEIHCSLILYNSLHFNSIRYFVLINFFNKQKNILLQAILAVVYLIPGDISSLIDLFSMTVWIFYVLAMIVLLILRKTKADAHRPYKVYAQLCAINITNYSIMTSLLFGRYQ